MNILGQLSSLQVRILQLAVDRPEKVDGGHGLPLALPLAIRTSELSEIVACRDLQRLDRELGQLVYLGLLGGLTDGIQVEADQAVVTHALPAQAYCTLATLMTGVMM